MGEATSLAAGSAVGDPGTNVPWIRADTGCVPSGCRHPDSVGDQGGAIVVGVDGERGRRGALDVRAHRGLGAWLHGRGRHRLAGWGVSSEGTPESDELAEGRARVHRMQGDVVARCLEQRGEDVPDLVRVVVHDYAGRVLVARAE